MGWITQLKKKAENLAKDPVLSQKDKSFINKSLEVVPNFLKTLVQMLVCIYIFRKLGNSLGFLEAITIQLAIIIVILRQVLTKKPEFQPK